MKRMMHPQNGWQMVQPADIPMFERAGWAEDAPEDSPVNADPVEQEQQKSEPVKTRKRRAKNDEGL